MFDFDLRITLWYSGNNLIGNTNDGCLDIASIVRFELSPFSDILVNFMVWDPNLKVFSGKFLKAQDLGTSAVGRSVIMNNSKL